MIKGARVINAAGGKSRREQRRTGVLYMGVGCFFLSALILARGLVIPVKAAAAQWLVAQSWEQSQIHGAALKPWPWSDYRVVGRLSVPALGVERFIFDRDDARALAFGPGFNAAAAQPHATGITAISGHRDTHFAFLKRLEPGMRVGLIRAGTSRELFYSVRSIEVVDSRLGVLPLGAPDDLALITCYPFEQMVPGGPLRLLVLLELEQPQFAGVLTL